MGICNTTDKPKEGRQNPTKRSMYSSQGDTEVFRSMPPQPQYFNIKIIEKPSNKQITLQAKPDQTLEQIFNELNYHKDADYEIISGNRDLSTSIRQRISALFNIGDDIEIKAIYKGLELPEDAIKAYSDNTNYVGSIILDNPEMLGIITYDTRHKKMNPFYFNKAENENLKKLNSFSAYCNAKNKLYISGGESDMDKSFDKSVLKYNEFYSIDMAALQYDSTLNLKELPNLSEVRTWHSMIFVPNNYIFIVGGENTKNVEVYDIEKNKVTVDSELINIRSEPTLCLINETYLYCFCGFLLHQNYHESVERCNLRKKNRIWEEVEFATAREMQFSPSFFGVSYVKGGIILVGGNDNVNEINKSYTIKFDECLEERGIIDEYEMGNDIICVFRDKFFMPIDERTAINIPLPAGDSVQIMKIDINEGKISKEGYKLVIENN